LKNYKSIELETKNVSDIESKFNNL